VGATEKVRPLTSVQNRTCLHNNLKDREATCLALDKPIDNSSSIRASQMRWPLNRSLVPFCKIKKKSYENQKKKKTG